MQHTLVQWIVRVRLQEQVLEADHNRVEVKHWFPVFTEDVQAYVALEVYVGVVNLPQM
jgi:hypothetical protein